jgi:hypothetical protein
MDCPLWRVDWVRGESSVSFFARLFGKRQRDTESTARHRAGRQGEPPVPAPNGDTGRPLFRDEVPGQGMTHPAGHSAGSIDHGPAPGIGSQEPAAPNVGGGSPLLRCPRCGNNNAAASRFCSHCGNPLRAAASAEGSSETTSTLSISGIEAYEAEMSGQQATPSLTPEAQAAVDALPPGSALLIVRRGPNSGSRFLLDSEVTTAGRHPESDIFLDDVTVSRRHVEFRRRPEGGFTASDVGSLNGTYVNREPIDSAVLSTGDEVQIGKYRLVFYSAD